MVSMIFLHCSSDLWDCANEIREITFLFAFTQTIFKQRVWVDSTGRFKAVPQCSATVHLFGYNGTNFKIVCNEMYRKKGLLKIFHATLKLHMQRELDTQGLTSLKLLHLLCNSQLEKLILISRCYQNHCQNPFWDSHPKWGPGYCFSTKRFQRNLKWHLYK